MSNQYNNIERPWKKNEWLIWPRTILNDINMSDCNDTIEGVCYENKSLEDCIKQCPYDECGVGVYVKFKSGDSICAPLKTSGHPNLSPDYRLRRQQMYNLDPDIVESSVFVNTKLFPFPPNHANTVFFGDIFELVSSDGKTKLNTNIVTNTDKAKRSKVVMDKDTISRCKLLPSIKSANHAMDDIPVLFGDKFEINSASTSFVAGVKNNLLQWKEALGIFGGGGLTFTFTPTEPGKITGDLVTYSDDVVISYSKGGTVSINSKNELYINMDQTYTAKFKLRSLMDGYYCDNGQCKTVPINKITPVRYPGTWEMRPPENVLSSGTYKGNNVFNHEGCWNICSYSEKDQGIISSSNNNFNPFPTFDKKPNLYLTIISIVLPILIVCIILYLRTLIN